jgi:hypothetical protein
MRIAIAPAGATMPACLRRIQMVEDVLVGYQPADFALNDRQPTKRMEKGASNAPARFL